MSVKLSVGVVAYRDYDALLRAVGTLEYYTSSAISRKIYVIDNGTKEKQSDQTKEGRADVIRHEKIIYIDAKGNRGYGAGNNLILEQLDSEYHCIMNPDIVFFEDAFSPILSYMDEHKDVGMVIPRIVDEHGKLLDICREYPSVLELFVRRFVRAVFKKKKAKYSRQKNGNGKPVPISFGQGSFMVIRTKLFQKLSGFDERFFLYFEDTDLCRRVNEKSKVMFFPDAKVMHRWKRSSYQEKKYFWIHLTSMKKYFDKWGWKWV